MGGHNQVRLARHLEVCLHIDTALPQLVHFLHEQHGVKHHAAANEAGLVLAEDARGYGAQHMVSPVELERVPRVGTALETGHHIVAGREHVDHLALALVAPL